MRGAQIQQCHAKSHALTTGRERSVVVHILEDDPGVSESLLLLLEQMGHQAVVYPNAEAFFDGEPPGAEDTVIVDLGLPGIGGETVIAWLNQLNLPPNVVVMSGQSMNAISAKLPNTLDISFIRKPLSEAAILSVL